MADIKTHLRELSVATTIGLLKSGVEFNKDELYDSKRFFSYAQEMISCDITNANNITINPIFTGELKQIVDNGFQLGKEICNNPHFNIKKTDSIYWVGNNTQKDDPVDIIVGNYRFSLKEDSFILENMGLYKLLNCYTGSKYCKRHIFKDYAPTEYDAWFRTTWNEMIKYLLVHSKSWTFSNPRKSQSSKITLLSNVVFLEFYKNNLLSSKCTLPMNCGISDYEDKTNSTIREEVFAKFINQQLDNNTPYNSSKKVCANVAAKALAIELNTNLNYHAGLPRFLRIYNNEYYYAKTTENGVTLYKVPSIDKFGNDIIIESIISSVPNTQANILTTIKNNSTGKTLVLRNECRFSHGQFNGTPEAKMYYEHGSSLLAIYEPI
jgi:hypothetical protein